MSTKYSFKSMTFAASDKLIRWIIIVGILFFGLFTVVVHVAAQPSVTINVNSTVDAVDANPGDGVCETASGNNICSLRAAIQTANATSAIDTINVPAGVYSLTLSGAFEDNGLTGDLDILEDLTIQGAGTSTTIVDGNSLDRIFHVVYSKTVTISGLTIQNGTNVASGSGVFNENGTLTLNDCVIKNNYSNLLNGNGGGVDNFMGYVFINNCEITGNQAQSNGGGIFNNLGVIQVQNSLVNNNTTGVYNGGGIGSTGTLLIDQSSISGNYSGAEGGGVYSSGLITVTNSTFSGNSATTLGGGLFISSTLSLENSTISTNTAVSSGGGIYNVITATLASATLAGNGAGSGGNIYNANFLTIKNSLIDASASGNNCTGTITSLGYNISSDSSCALSGTGDQNSVNPQIGPLQDNGGESYTHALPITSPAIDGGNPAGCTDNSGNPLIYDQRGLYRTVDSNGDLSEICDIGAYEYAAAELSISKTDNQTIATPGFNTVYTVTVNNTGPAKVNAVTISDTFGADFSAATWTCSADPASSCDTDSGSGDINLGVNLAVGESATVIITATVNPTATNWLTNTATITPLAGLFETITSDNTDTDVDSLSPDADISVTKSASPEPVIVNELLTYQVQVNNAGPSLSTSIFMTDTLPNNVTFDNVSGTGWTCNGNDAEVSCSRPSLPVGDSPLITIQVYAPSSIGVITNTVTITSTQISDPNPTNNTDTLTSTVKKIYYANLPVVLR